MDSLDIDLEIIDIAEELPVNPNTSDSFSSLSSFFEEAEDIDLDEPSEDLDLEEVGEEETPEDALKGLTEKYSNVILSLEETHLRLSREDKSSATNFSHRFKSLVNAYISKAGLGSSSSMITNMAINVVYRYNSDKARGIIPEDPVEILKEQCKISYRNVLPKVGELFRRINQAYELASAEALADTARANIEGKIISKYYLKDILPPLQDLTSSNQGLSACFPKSVRRKGQHFEIICGNCEASLNSSFPLFVIFLQSVKKSKEELIRGRKALPQPVVCSCGKINILSEKTHEALETRIENIVKIPEHFLNPQSSISPSGMYINYIPSDSLLQDELRELYFIERDVASDGLSDSEFSGRVKDLMRVWYVETNEYVKSLRKQRYREFRTLDNSRSELNREYYSNYLELVARSLCRMFNYKFSTLRDNAIASLHNYMKMNPLLMAAISPVSQYVGESLLMLEDYFKLDPDEIGTPEQAFSLYRKIALALDAEWDDNWTESDLAQIAVSCYDALDKVHESQQVSKSFREVFMEELNKSARIFGLIEIKNLVAAPEVLAEAFVTSESRKWVEDVCNYMILNYLSKKYFPYWSSFSYGGKENRISNSKFNTAKNKGIDKNVEIFKKLLGDHRKRLGSRFSPFELNHLFLSTSPLLVQVSYGMPVGHLSSIRAAYMNKDEISLAFLCNKLPVMDTGSLVEGLRTLVEFTKSSLGHLVSLYDDKFGFYKHYYGDMFSDEEIRKDLNEVDSHVKVPIILKRNGKSFGEYIKELQSGSFESLDLVRGRNWELWGHLSRFLPAICAFSNMSETLSGVKEKSEAFISYDVLCFSYVYGMEEAFNFLELPLPTPEDVRDLTPLSWKVDESAIRASIMVDNFVYPTELLEFVKTKSHPEYLSIDDYIFKELPNFTDQLITFKFKEFVNDYYSS